MHRLTTLIATAALAGSLSSGAWAQGAAPGGAGQIGGANGAGPSGAAITHTPGTPGASDTPGALQSDHSGDSSPDSLSPSEIRKLKKQAKKAAESSAPISDTAKSPAP